MVAPAGAGPWPQITSTWPLRTSWTMTGTSPPGPLRCGSTTWSVKAVAAAASKALPPRSNVAMPTAVAIQCVEATTPKVPSISGRVVKGFGLMFFMGSCAQVWNLPPNHSLRPGPTRLAFTSFFQQLREKSYMLVSMTKLLEKALEVVRRLPPDSQDEIAQAMLRLAAGDGEPKEIDAAHLPAVLEGLAQAKRRQFATDAEIEAAFRRFDR